MTIDEEIRILDPETTAESLAGYSDDEAIQLVEDACRVAVAALREKQERRWIPVAESLPEPKEKALCISRDGKMMVGIYTEWGWTFPCYFGNLTHWMPLPELPKEET